MSHFSQYRLTGLFAVCSSRGKKKKSNHHETSAVIYIGIKQVPLTLIKMRFDFLLPYLRILHIRINFEQKYEAHFSSHLI